MSKKLENKFKEQLENYEAPHDGSAWESFEKKLDSKATSGNSKILKTAVAVGVLTVASVGIFFYSNDSNDIETKYTKESTVEEKVKPNKAESDFVEEKTEQKSEKGASEVKIASEDKTTKKDDGGSITENIDKNAESGNNQVKEEKDTATSEESNESSKADQKQNKTDENSNTEDTKVKRRFVSGVVSTKEVCKGDYITVENNHEEGFVRLLFGRTDLTVPPKQFTKLKVEDSGVLTFIDGEEKTIEEVQIKANELPEVDFSYEANVYEKGLPIVELRAFGSFEKYIWKLNNDKKAEGKVAGVNIYDKGEHIFKLEVVDHNGCKGSNSRNIRIEEDYNLMAPSAFRPQSSDRRKNTFIPYALTERDVEFEFVVIDPKTHAVVFKSNDKDNPWDGRDQRTGKMTSAEKVFMWKVHIENPRPGEKAIYAGSVVHD